MEKNSTLQTVTLLVIILTVLAFISGGATIADAYDLLITIASVVVLVAAISLGSQTGTEGVKFLLRWLGGLVGWAKFIIPNKYGSWLIAGLIAFGAVHGFDIDFFSQFDNFSSVDEKLIQFLNSLIVWGSSGLWHSALPAGILKAPAKA